MHQADIVCILDAIEQQDFIEETYIASYYTVVANIIGKNPKIMLLLEQKRGSFSLILARYREKKASMTDETRLVYFVLFGLCCNTIAIPRAGLLLDRLPRRARKERTIFLPMASFFMQQPHLRY